MKNIMKRALALVFALVLVLTTAETSVVYAAPSHKHQETNSRTSYFSKGHLHIFNRAIKEKWTNATCENYATQTWGCSKYVTKNGKKVLCGEEVTIISGLKLSHNYVSTATEKSEGVYQCSCGAVEYTACKGCREYRLFGLVHISHSVVKVAQKLPHTHVVVEDAAVNATCTTTGLTAGSHCATCGEVIVAQQEVAMGEHDWYVVKEYTYCNAEGVRYYKCTAKCGATKEEVVAPTGHTWATVAEKAPTCTETGHSAYDLCTKCGVYTAYETIPMLGHDWYVTFDSTSCTVEGEKASECTRCDEKKVEVVEPTGHTWTEVAAKAPTCKEDGHYGYSLCSTCGHTTYTEYDSIPKTGHEIVTVIIKAPVGTEHGWAQDECAHCHKVFIEKYEVCYYELQGEKCPAWCMPAR